jgi:urease accessory protein
VKTVPLGQSAGQRLLGRLADALPSWVEQALLNDPARRQNFAPVLAILAARHEAQYSRLFRS